MKGRTYRYMTEDPLYPFGFGLSYTNYYFSKPVLSSNTVRNGSTVRVRVNVLNGGQMDGSEAVQVYVKRLDDAGAPIKALKGFQKLTLKAGETQTATITLDGEAFEYYDDTIYELAVKPGRYQIFYGTSSLDKDLQSFDFVVK